RSRLHSLQLGRFVWILIGAEWWWRNNARALFRSGETVSGLASWSCAPNSCSRSRARLRQHALENYGHRRRFAPLAARLLLRRRRTARSRKIHGAPARDHF